VRFRGTLANLLGTDASDVSLLHALTYLSSNGGLWALLGTTGGAQQDLVEGGAQLIADRLAERLGDSLVLGAPARTIEQGERDVSVTSDDLEVRARAAVIAVPPALAARIAYAPTLPSARDQLAQRMAHGDVTKLVALYDEAFWRHAGLSGETWGSDLPFAFSYDVSGAGGAPGAIAIFYTGAAAHAARVLGAERRRTVALAALARCFGPQAERPVAVIERDWADEEWTRGAYGAFMPPGAWTSLGHALRPPNGRIAFAGSERAVEGIGYIEGAVESAERAAAHARNIIA
jgi:monoamine oxidase